MHLPGFAGNVSGFGAERGILVYFGRCGGSAGPDGAKGGTEGVLGARIQCARSGGIKGLVQDEVTGAGLDPSAAVGRIR